MKVIGSPISHGRQCVVGGFSMKLWTRILRSL